MVFRFAGFELDQQRAELRGPYGEVIRLRLKTFEMLRLFAANAGRVLSKTELMEALWPNVHVGEDSLFQCIRELRGALGDERRQTIKLVSGRGYRFDAEVSITPDGPPANAEAVLSTRASEPTPNAGTAAVPPRTTRTIAVMPIIDASSDPGGATMAAGVTACLIDGLARIDNIGVVAHQSDAAATRSEQHADPSTPSDFILRGELHRGPQSWTLQARIIRMTTGEVQSVATASVIVDESDLQLQQSRLAAGAGHPLARRLNELLAVGESASAFGGSARFAIEQAAASINHSTRERFGMAQTMLQNALVAEPDNVDLAVALASLQMRGIQMVFYSPDDSIAAEAQAGAILQRALRIKPGSIPVLETYCRFLSATNRFVESLVACATALSFDPWNGAVLYLVGLGQLHLGRFDEALATFQQADRFDTPQTSRWAWLLGAGWVNLLMGRNKDALPWLKRSIAITSASGRSHMLLAVAWQKSGRISEARTAMTEGLRLRPGTTALNVAPPIRNASPVFVEASDRLVRLMVEAGLPES